MRIIILTANSLRHDYIRKTFGISKQIQVLKSYLEEKKGQYLEDARNNGEKIRIFHLEQRILSEHDYFAPFTNTVPDWTNPSRIPFGSINERQYFNEIVELNPDLIVVYGSSLLKDPLLSKYDGRILNVHLGLSPYYRGGGTNFWALVNNEPEYVGATFMYIDAGVDTGEIIHQLRARVHPNDGPHDIGNRLIADVGQVYPELVRKFDSLYSVDQPPVPEVEHVYSRDDYNPQATRSLYENFESGMIEQYLDEIDTRIEKVPIVKHPVINEDELITKPAF